MTCYVEDGISSNVTMVYSLAHFTCILEYILVYNGVLFSYTVCGVNLGISLRTLYALT
jgi:hypothetical protein